MTRSGTAVLVASLAALAAACGPGGAPLGAADVPVRAVPDFVEADLGHGFPLTVIRTWERDVDVAAWDDAALAPLAARAVGVSVRSDGRVTQETRTFVAYAFTAGDVTVPPLRLEVTPRDGSAAQVRVGDAVHVRVRATLDARDPGVPELPPGPFPVPPPRWLWGACALAAAAGVWGATRMRRTTTAPVAAALPVEPVLAAPSPDAVALGRLDALRRRDGGDGDDSADGADATAWYAELATVVRDYVGARWGVPAAERTTEEIVDACGVPGDPARRLLSAALAACDGVKFGRAAAGAADRRAAVTAATDFVRATATSPATTHVAGAAA